MPPISERHRSLIALGLLGLTLFGLLVLLVRLPPPRGEVRVVRPTPSPAPTELIVHVAGAVAEPGLYRFLPGQRVEDAIRAAGGPAPDADLDRLNLAAPVRDGEQIMVPRRAGTVRETEPGQAPLDLNRATRSELDDLPGIGPAISARIVEYRQAHGPFRRVEDLRDLKLVPASTYERIKALVVIQ